MALRQLVLIKPLHRPILSQEIAGPCRYSFCHIKYGDGSSVTGNLGNDTVGVPGTNISATGSILFATQTQGMNFGSSTVYGLVGMDINSYPNFLDGASSAG